MYVYVPGIEVVGIEVELTIFLVSNRRPAFMLNS